jgi:phosphatidylglycerol:prolipoprotein diacylglycerol transferase
MFPNASFLGMDLYVWSIAVGILAAVVVYRLTSDRDELPVRVFNFSLLTVVVAIAVGYLSAVLFQSWYSFLATGVWKWGVGATFYGGLIGGVLCFLLIYFILGHFLYKDKIHVSRFPQMASLMIPCIVLAHAFGRLGCLFDGCCYGAKTDSPIGIDMYIDGVWEKRVPTQLFESLFLFLLFGVLLYLKLKRNNQYIPSVYLIAYGVWRFILEYFRDDSRGASGISFLTPSQLTAIVMVLFGIALAILYRYVFQALLKRLDNDEQQTVA